MRLTKSISFGGSGELDAALRFDAVKEPAASTAQVLAPSFDGVALSVGEPSSTTAISCLREAK